MSAWKIPSGRIDRWLYLILTNIILAACAPAAPPVTPPASYTGPIAEQPLGQEGDYWIYESVSQNRSKTTRLVEEIGFPLWIGKTWMYEGSALLRGQPATSKANRTPTKIECFTVGYTDVTVPAGSFRAFQCDCKCSILSLQYDPSCGEWTIWYAPEIRNIIKREAESTQASLVLIDYNGRRRPPVTKTPPRKGL